MMFDVASFIGHDVTSGSRQLVEGGIYMDDVTLNIPGMFFFSRGNRLYYVRGTDFYTLPLPGCINQGVSIKL